MDRYLESHLLGLFPELSQWASLDAGTRLWIYEQLNQREKAWVQNVLMKKPEQALRLWELRPCDDSRHHECPECHQIPEFIPGSDQLVCMNLECPYVRDSKPGFETPWMGTNHVKKSDASCGELRWDSWDW